MAFPISISSTSSQLGLAAIAKAVTQFLGWVCEPDPAVPTQLSAVCFSASCRFCRCTL